MKTRISFLVIFFTIFVNGNLSAQISFAPRLGFNFSHLTGDTEDNTSRLRVHVGCILNADINKMISFQPGINISGKGATFVWDDEDKDAVTLTYLEVPLNCVLNSELNPGKVQIFAGPYIGICLGGKIKYLADEDNEEESIRIGTSEDDEIKPLDLGMSIGLGYKIQDFQIQFSYAGSLTSISVSEKDEIKNSVISFSLAYFFSL